jgi:histidine triad (HIT) family protein
MSDCLFCKIRDEKIPAKFVHRDDQAFAIEDINPQAPTHVLVIPREHVATLNDLGPQHDKLVGHLVQVAQKIAADRGHAAAGYRVVMNCNRDAGQTVFHIHLHLLGGRVLGWPPG